MKPFVLFLFIFVVSQLQGQIVYKDENDICEKQELQNIYFKSIQILDSLETIGFGIIRMDILEIDSQKYLLPDGHFNVYKWTGDDWKNIYKGIHYGYNYLSKKFVFKDNLYSFGGYGYWKSHGQVIQFLFDRGEWELLEFTKSLKNGYASVEPFGLKVIRDTEYNIDIVRKKVDDLPKSTLNLYKIGKFYSNAVIYDFDKYTLIYNGQRLLYDKLQKKYYISELSPFKNLHHADSENYLVHLVGDSIAIYDRNMALIEATSVNSEMRFYSPYQVVRNSRISDALIYALISLVLTIMAFYFIKSKKKRVSYQDPLIDKLLLLRGKTLTQTELDSILEISDIKNPETLKGTRSTAINKINKKTSAKEGANLIVRIKDPEDKRRYLYKISNI